jgi:hypothetical protein
MTRSLDQTVINAEMQRHKHPRSVVQLIMRLPLVAFSCGTWSVSDLFQLVAPRSQPYFCLEPPKLASRLCQCSRLVLLAAGLCPSLSIVSSISFEVQPYFAFPFLAAYALVFHIIFRSTRLEAGVQVLIFVPCDSLCDFVF